jgi:TolB-like protein/DNA-binding winged helix-turn-helix (wHTH) protein/Flp pilus assembly protein TadD
MMALAPKLRRIIVFPEQPMEGDFRLGEWLVCPQLNTVQAEGQASRIEHKCMQVLVCLADRPEQIISKEDLIRIVWADTFVTDEVLTRAISELRRTFSDDPKKPRLIETIPKRGYRIIAPVQRVTALNAPDESVARKFSWKLRGVIFSALLFAATIVAFRFPRTGTTPDSVRIQSIAVIPLENLSQDPQEQYFADGMTDELINKLAQIKSLRVVSRTSVRQLKSTHKTLPEITQLLNVDAIVEGTVLRSGSHLRINAELVDTKLDKQLWAQSYDRDISDVLAIQSDLALAIIKGIQLSTTPEDTQQLTRPETVSPEAYDAYLKGLFYWNQFSELGMKKAVDYFQQAIAIDPNYAPAYAGLAQTYHELAIYMPPREVMPKGKAAATKALQLDNSIAEAHAALGWILWCYDWDWRNGEREFLKAIELAPMSSLAHAQYSIYLSSAGRPDDALREITQARELDPFSAVVSTVLGEAHGELRHYDEAERIFLTTIEMHPDFSQVHADHGTNMIWQKRFPEGIREIRKAIELDTDASYQASLTWAYAQSGDTVNAKKSLADLLKYAKNHYISAFTLAAGYAYVGDKTNSLRWLQRASEDRDFGMVFAEKDYSFPPIHTQ